MSAAKPLDANDAAALSVTTGAAVVVEDVVATKELELTPLPLLSLEPTPTPADEYVALALLLRFRVAGNALGVELLYI